MLDRVQRCGTKNPRKSKQTALSRADGEIRGTGSIDFTKIGKILLFTLGLYLMSALFSFIQGWIMTGVTQKVCYRLRKEISEKINRMPMKYFESRTYGEVFSRITNDVDTLGQGLNQSITTIITSVATLVGVLIMMLSISPLMTLIALVILPISIGLIGLVTKRNPRNSSVTSRNIWVTSMDRLRRFTAAIL